ncbi:MAG TPA: LLM class flavin-dependent oxidoreductase, partial [Dehalococcoidia bacterium]|nr:LLM class flavin-dependent oxidoreductase [Dehalococcoidia bacterium]
LADEYGYDNIKVIEHYFNYYGGYSPSPSTFLAAISQRTRRTRLVTGAVIPAFNHPLKLAGELAMVDCMSNGRLDVGVARAFLPHEFEAFGVSMAESRGRHQEGIDALIRLWTEENVTFEGTYHHFRNVTSLPRPVQQPYPPIWIAAIVTEESFRWAGERGFRLMVVPYLADYPHLAQLLNLYKTAYREHGHGEPPGVMLILHLYLAEDDATARREAQERTENYIKTVRQAATPWIGREEPQYVAYSQLCNLLDAMTYDRVLKETRAIIGDPERATDQLGYIFDSFGPVSPNFQMMFGGTTFDQSVRTMRLFAERVRPRLRT